jgi:hypothetical protein
VQQPEVWHAARIGYDRFAIKDQVVRGQGGECIGDRLKALRPVVAPPV